MELFVEKYQIFFGISFILSTAFLVLVIARKAYNSIYKNIILHISIKNNIKNLSQEEMEYLENYFYNSKDNKYLLSSYAPFSNGLTTSLLNKNILYWSGGRQAAATKINYQMCVPFNLTTCAYKHLNNSIVKKAI
jgi:hypothetical protein